MDERWFAIAGVLMLVISLAMAGGAMTSEAEDQSVWTPDVPTLESLASPSADGTVMSNQETYDSVQSAVNAAEPGDEIVIDGTIEERIIVDTPNITIRGATESAEPARIDGGGTDTVVTIDAPNVTVTELQITGSGEERRTEDAGIDVNATDATIDSVRIDDVTFGIWVSRAPNATITNNEISGAPDRDVSLRGNGIHLFEADGAVVTNNAITDVRDGIYYQWASDVIATDNRLWNLRYGVHYMYSDNNILAGNLAFNNDIGFALMVSENLTIIENQAVDNRDGPSQHGILIKDIDDSTISGNDIVGNGNGLYVYNAQDNEIRDNLVLENAVGIHYTAGSSGETIAGNSFIHNDRPGQVTATSERSTWNATGYGNYWSDARTIDLDGDGTSQVRYQPAGAIEQLIDSQPAAAVFAESPAFDAVRLAESSFPVLGETGVVDQHPLTEPPHDYWREYYEHNN